MILAPSARSRTLTQLQSRKAWAVTLCVASLASMGATAEAQQAQSTPLPQIVVTPPVNTVKPARKRRAPTPVAKTEEPANQLGTYNPALDLKGLTLPPGTTLTTAGPVLGYQALSAFSATKTATPIEQIPQSIQVIPRSVLADQLSVTPAEALRNVSGAQGMNPLSTPTFDASKLRGFPAEQWTDGLSVYYNAGDRDSLVNVERIEVLKGPSAILYGGGSGDPLGGVFNFVSKLPKDLASQEIGVTFGSHRYVQPYFDINQPLNSSKTVLFRMTGQYTGSDSFIDALHTQRYSLHPALTLTNRNGTSFTVQADFSNWKQKEYQGLPATGTVFGNFALRSDMFIGPSNVPDSYSRREAVTLTLDHRLDPIWSMNLKARFSRSEFDEQVQTLFGQDGFQANKPFIPGTSFWGLANAHLHQLVHEQTVTGHVKGEFQGKDVKSTFVLGADYSRVTDKGFLDAEFAPAFVDLTNPAYPAYTEPTAAGRFQDASNVYVTKGAYAQLLTSLWKRVHLLAGVRIASISIENNDPVAFNFQVSDTAKLLPRVGAVVEVVPGISVFGSYSEGMKANPFVNYSGPAKPEFSDQIEGGLKLQLPYGLSGTLAMFEINRSNVPVANAATPGLSIAAGEQRSRGVEADLLWQPGRNWQFIANYAHVNATLTKEIPATFTSAAIPAGNFLNGVPTDSGRIWANYKFDGMLTGWSLGGGVYIASSQFVELANEFKTPTFHSVDAKLAYDTKSFGVSLSVKNLTAQHYYEPFSYFGGRVAPVSGPEVYGRIVFRN